jgi:hypothetical protein
MNNHLIACLKSLAFIIICNFIFIDCARAQSELMPYGNLNGIRIKGQLMPFTSNITVAGKDLDHANFTAKERQRPKFKREGNIQTVNTAIDNIDLTETVEDLSSGSIRINIKCVSKKDTVLKGVFLNVTLPGNLYAAGADQTRQVNARKLPPIPAGEERDYRDGYIRHIIFYTPSNSFKISAASPTLMIKKGSANKDIRLYFPLQTGMLKKGQIYENTYTIQVTGRINTAPATMVLDTLTKGREFAGFGGNFRLQNPKTDPQVIDYCLQNMRVAWGRVEMPWKNWHPVLENDPTANAEQGKLDEHVRQSMEMAQRLAKMNMPVILTAWAPPAWAVVGELRYGPTPQGVWGNPLNKERMPEIYKSITDYILYLKKHYGFEVKYFSFNESDLGINIRQTGEEHDELIKGLGAYFVSKGLGTKLLLGDNSDATTYKFIYPAMNDPEARPYIGAVSFHSWRGWDTPTLEQWAEAAKQLNLPLLVGEGSIDAAAWAYPPYFEEQSYALEEINLYTRLLSICQPLSILQWQLTADYSPLTGGGVFGIEGPLTPTQRFWNLKQLASTPEGVYNMPLTIDRSEISCAALGNVNNKTYTIHMVNNSAARKVTIKGLPASVKRFKLITTDKTHNMQQLSAVTVKNHEANFTLNERCFVTLVSE